MFSRSLPRLRHVLRVAAFLILSAHTLHAQDRDALDGVRVDWHLAGIAEAQNNWKLAISTYRAVLGESTTLPLNIREWYRGTAGYGIARCAARMALANTARSALAYAAEHHFWNFELIRRDSALVSIVGLRTIDSLETLWVRVARAERSSWLPQIPVIFTPRDYDNSPRWPLIIAMHGGNGNYESFAARWKQIADTLHAVIAIPAGILRESQISNAWGDSSEQIAQAIIPLARDLINRRLVDSNQVFLTGFSQGAQATINLVLRHPHIFRGGIPMCGFSHDVITDAMLAEARSVGARLYAITGQFEDPNFRTEINAMQQRCNAVGVPFHLEIEPNMIHEVPFDLIPQFIAGWRWIHDPAQK